MKKLTLLLAFAFTALAGCHEQVKTVYQEKDVPVYVVPTPPKVEKPDLAINHLTDKQKDDIGELSKAYNISLVQTLQYACKLQKIVDKYAYLSTLSPAPVNPLLDAISTTNILNVNLDQGCDEKN